MKTFNVRFNHEILGFVIQPVEAETYSEAGEKIRRELRERFPNALFRLASETPIELSDTEKQALEES